MSYDHAKYNALRSLDVPRRIALALADDSNPLNVPTVLDFEQIANVAQVDEAAELVDVIQAVNDLLTNLKTSGLMAEDA